MKQMMVNNHDIDVSHPEKIMFPDAGITKEDMIHYYGSIAPYMLPHIKNRPITMHRFPDGIDAQGFYMKECPDYFPGWIETVKVMKKEGGHNQQVIAQNKETLVYLANQACITPHVWLSTRKHLHKPDKMIFDLDPSTGDAKPVKKAALSLKKIIAGHGLTAFVMTTGSEGLHVVVPIKPLHSFDEVREAAVCLAKEAIEQSPDLLTLEQRKDKRGDKVFLDTLRNAYGQTSVAPYALRPLPGAPVATPLTWEQLERLPFDPKKYTATNVFRRLGQTGDPWEGFFETEQDMSFIPG